MVSVAVVFFALMVDLAEHGITTASTEDAAKEQEIMAPGLAVCISAFRFQLVLEKTDGLVWKKPGNPNRDRLQDGQVVGPEVNRPLLPTPFPQDFTQCRVVDVIFLGEQGQGLAPDVAVGNIGNHRLFLGVNSPHLLFRVPQPAEG